MTDRHIVQDDIKVGDYLLNAEGSSSGWRIVAITSEGYAIAHPDMKVGKVIPKDEIKNYKIARSII